MRGKFYHKFFSLAAYFVAHFNAFIERLSEYFDILLFEAALKLKIEGSSSPCSLFRNEVFVGDVLLGFLTVPGVLAYFCFCWFLLRLLCVVHSVSVGKLNFSVIFVAGFLFDY